MPRFALETRKPNWQSTLTMIWYFNLDVFWMTNFTTQKKHMTISLACCPVVLHFSLYAASVSACILSQSKDIQVRWSGNSNSACRCECVGPVICWQLCKLASPKCTINCLSPSACWETLSNQGYLSIHPSGWMDKYRAPHLCDITE